MAVTTTNLLQGPFTLYRGAFGAAEPTDSTLNATPGAAWVDLGGTNDGLTLKVADEYSMLEVDQVIENVAAIRTKREATLSTNLAEVTLANWAIAMNEVAPTTGTSPVGSVFEPAAGLNNLPIYSALLADGYAPGGFRRRVLIRKALQTGDIEASGSKTDQTLLPVEFTSFYVSSTIKPFRIIDGIA